jgi:uncharacterized protein YegP (UPF0339 family)
MRVYEGLTVDRTYPCFTFYEDTSGEWRWTLYSRNKRKVADGSEGYSDRRGVKKALRRVWKLFGGVASELAWQK